MDGNRVDLTQKEFELLLYLARHADSTVTRAMLVRDIWGYATEEDNSRTVDSHIKTLRLKLGDAGLRTPLYPDRPRDRLPADARRTAMKRSLRGLYWVAIACMLVMAVVAVALLLDFRVKDRSESLRDILEAVSAWTLESRDDLQSHANHIASVSAPVRVTFLSEAGR